MKIKEQELVESIYNLILNPSLSDEERKILVEVKNKLGVGTKNNDRIFIEMNHSIRQLAVSTIGTPRKMTPEFMTFYQKLSDFCEQRANLARGLVAFGINFR